MTSEQEVVVEAENEAEAIEMASSGDGELVDEILTWPTVVGIEKLDE
jgi:hypothetical protein